jgi:hypothetical protein
MGPVKNLYLKLFAFIIAAGLSLPAQSYDSKLDEMFYWVTHSRGVWKHEIPQGCMNNNVTYTHEVIELKHSSVFEIYCINTSGQTKKLYQGRYIDTDFGMITLYIKQKRYPLNISWNDYSSTINGRFVKKTVKLCSGESSLCNIVTEKLIIDRESSESCTCGRSGKKEYRRS